MEQRKRGVLTQQQIDDIADTVRGKQHDGSPHATASNKTLLSSSFENTSFIMRLKHSCMGPQTAVTACFVQRWVHACIYGRCPTTASDHCTKSTFTASQLSIAAWGHTSRFLALLEG